jgi:hypothetical protein
MNNKVTANNGIISWSLDVKTKKEIKLYSKDVNLKIIQVGIGRFVTQFEDFENIKISVKFQAKLLLRLKYPFGIVLGKNNMSVDFLPRGLLAAVPVGAIELRLIEKRTLEVYMNMVKVGEVKVRNPNKLTEFIYAVLLSSNLGHEQICYIFITLACYFIMFVDESGIRGLMMWEEKYGKRQLPYFD